MIARTSITFLTAIVLGASAARADVVLDWNAVMVTTLTGQNPFAQARFAAIMHLAVHEAVNAIEGGYEPYLGTIEAPPGASAEAAAVAAAHRVLISYFPGSAAAIDAARMSSLAAIADGQAKSDGVAVGEAAAAAMVALRAADGSAPPQFHLPSSNAAGEWRPTPGCPPSGGILKHWPNVRPFALESSRQFRSAPPPDLTSKTYTRSFDEVAAVGGFNSTLRPADRADVARFYAVVGAVPSWNPVARQLAVAHGGSLTDNARAFALLNMAISDGLVSSMETKYHYNVWRPETAIRAASNPAFMPFIVTPCFPTYPSAHASASYAARAVLEKLYGADGHSIILWSPAVPGVTLHYSTLKQMTRDIDDARVFGGIHFRFDQAAGGTQGAAVGDYVRRRKLRPVPRR